ncbi:Sec-independent protein translocase protein TatB [Helicobacter sp.]|uniref:Sec-independent protein translocase protein TatB n=1 Tax=Helicobacter sp. TaxID=218 RepID=UPI0019C9518F|nr:Sec-independent protein translocase protein TatB [Helicobacter sp.]MBD5164263.1 Sec-independent protein translocase subunit TatB [Helicobacter sp.]
MFGMGFFEILMIAVVAIIFLGPEKLPKALVDMAKFFRAVKKTMDEAKESLEREVNLSKIKEEALAYKNSLTQEVQTLSKDLELKELNLDLEESLLEPKKSPNSSENPIQTPISTQNLQDSAPQADSTLAESHTNASSKREIQLHKNDKTTLSFGANLTPSQTQEAQNDASQSSSKPKE